MPLSRLLTLPALVLVLAITLATAAWSFAAIDLDGDSFDSTEDCDDADATIFPGAAEVCDGLDNDCDGSVDEGFDQDADGFTTCGGDCDDANPVLNTSCVCPCWDRGGPFYTPAAFCHKAPTTRFGYVTGTFAQTVNFGAFSYCRNNGLFAWTTSAEHAACNHSLNLACSNVLAQAYIDRNDNDRFDHGDGLIAKFVDSDGSGMADAGDEIVTDVYPASPLSTLPGGVFGSKAEVCTPSISLPTHIACMSTSGAMASWGTPAIREFFFADFSHGDSLGFVDHFGCPGDTDGVAVQANAPFSPSSPVSPTFACQPGDQNFIDVDIFVSPAPAPAPPP